MSSLDEFQFDELFISSSPQHSRNSSNKLKGSIGSAGERESIEEDDDVFEADDTVYDYEEEEEQEGGAQTVVDDAHKASLRESVTITTTINVESFEVRSLVGKGAYGKVRQVVKTDTNEVFALKSLLKKHIIDTKCVENTIAEKDILRKVKHPFVVRLHYAFQNASKLYLVMDFISGGPLLHHMRNSRFFAESRARFYIAEVILAIEHLHSLDMYLMTRLLQNNVLLGADGHCVLTDFGFAKQNVTSPDSCHSFCGTMEYMAPEVIQKNRYGKAADWWSVGILLFDMLTGHPPFQSPNDAILCKKILTEKFNPQRLFTLPCANLLTGLLCRNISTRLTVEQIKAHKFFNGMNWEMLAAKELKPPFIPKGSADDVCNFDKDLTSLSFGESPVASPLSSSLQAQFAGFSYVRSFDGAHLKI